MGSRVLRVLGILLATATCISIVKNGFSIDLHGLPAKVFAQYAWMRDTLFEPVAWLLKHFGLTLPWWLKDAIVAYGLVASAHWRALSDFSDDAITYELMRGFPDAPSRFSLRDLRAALLWPAFQIGELRRFWKMLKARRRQDLAEVFAFHHGNAVRRAIPRNLLVAVSAAAAFFLWNHLQSVFGPGG